MQLTCPTIMTIIFFLLFLLIGGEIWRDIFDKLCKIMDKNIRWHLLNTYSSELYWAELLNRHAERIQNRPSLQKHQLMRLSGLFPPVQKPSMQERPGFEWILNVSE